MCIRDRPGPTGPATPFHEAPRETLMPIWRHLRSAASLALLAITLTMVPARAAEPIGGMPFSGEAGVAETIAEIMNRERTAPRLDEETDQEAELTQPDRTHLP